MNAFDIYTDSAANIPDELVARHDIRMIPYTCTVNGVERFTYEKDRPFRDCAKEFYTDLRAGADIKTSLVSEAAFISAIEPSLAAGRDVLVITITESLSGTTRQAQVARDALLERYPDRKIFVIDSCNASMGEGLLALKAADLRDMGESVEACAEWVENNRYKLNSYVTVDDLKFLRKSGRVSMVKAIAGAILGIKPILHADGGTPARLTFFSKERGRKKALAALLTFFDENVISPESQTLAITHADCEEEALELRDELLKRGARDVIIEFYDLCTGSHVGPGTIALFFMGKDRRDPAPEEKPAAVGARVPVRY